MSGGEITETEMTDEEVKSRATTPEMFALDEYLEKEERSLASEEYKFQEMQKERSARAKKKLENQVLIDMLKVAGKALETQVEKYTEVLLCPMSLQLFRDPVFCIGDGHTYEKEMIEEWFKRNNIGSYQPYQVSMQPRPWLERSDPILREKVETCFYPPTAIHQLRPKWDTTKR